MAQLVHQHGHQLVLRQSTALVVLHRPAGDRDAASTGGLRNRRPCGLDIKLDVTGRGFGQSWGRRPCRLQRRCLPRAGAMEPTHSAYRHPFAIRVISIAMQAIHPSGTVPPTDPARRLPTSAARCRAPPARPRPPATAPYRPSGRRASSGGRWPFGFIQRPPRGNDFRAACRSVLTGRSLSLPRTAFASARGPRLTSSAQFEELPLVVSPNEPKWRLLRLRATADEAGSIDVEAGPDNAPYRHVSQPRCG